MVSLDETSSIETDREDTNGVKDSRPCWVFPPSSHVSRSPLRMGNTRWKKRLLSWSTGNVEKLSCGWPLTALLLSIGNCGLFLTVPWWTASAAAYVLHVYLAYSIVIGVSLWRGYTAHPRFHWASKLATALSICVFGFVVYAITRPMH